MAVESKRNTIRKATVETIHPPLERQNHSVEVRARAKGNPIAVAVISDTNCWPTIPKTTHSAEDVTTKSKKERRNSNVGERRFICKKGVGKI
ncbi:hypothetical protein GCM10023212_06060 [Luteolibacter yonseiensis]